MSKEKRRKLINICLFILALLITQEVILFALDRKESIITQFPKKWMYSSAIEKGLQFYTSQKVEKLKIDEYLLFREINQRENKTDLTGRQEKYAEDPFKRILNKNEYITELFFDRSSFGQGMNQLSGRPIYRLNDPYAKFLEEPWDDVILKALYCDIVSYDDADFSVLKSVKTNDGGYWDTHVLLSLLILQENKCYSSEKIDEQIRQATEKIILAERTDKIFSDLYAERIVFLYWAGLGNVVKKEWVDIVKDNLTDDPGWRRERAFFSNAHTTGLALLSLIYYREGENRQSFYPHTKMPSEQIAAQPRKKYLE